MELLEWYNLVFILPFGAALMYLLLLASGTSMDHGIGAEVDADADLDFGGDIDHGFDHGIEHSLDQGHDHGDGSGMFTKALSILGVGKIPLSLVVICFCFLWGFTGWASNLLLEDIIPSILHPWGLFFPSLIFAGVSSVTGTRYLAKGLSKVMPSIETYGTSDEDLVGKVAEARYPITSQGGSALVRDTRGNLHEVMCKTGDGEEVIQSGQKVVLMRCDQGVFYVRLDPLEVHGIRS